MERVTNTMFRTVTTDPNAPAAELPFAYRGGDIAINATDMLYRSSVGASGGFKYFFSIDLNYAAGDLGTTPGTPYASRLIHADPKDSTLVSTLTRFATADREAFDADGRLISQESERGILSIVDPATGANGEVGVEGVDYVRLFQMGTLHTFADLASALVFEAPMPMPILMPMPMPSPPPSPVPVPTPAPEFCCSPDDEGAECDVVTQLPENYLGQ